MLFMTTLNASPLSLGPMSVERLKNSSFVNKWSCLRLSLSPMIKGSFESQNIWFYLWSLDGLNSTLKLVVNEILCSHL